MDDDALAVETYLQVRAEDGADAFDVQARLAKIPRYIGSFIVDTEEVGGGEHYPFDVAVGFNGTTKEVNDAVAAARATDGVADLRETRNRSLVPRAPLPGDVAVEIVVEEIVVEIEGDEDPEGS